jgi:hypothetical protein
MDEIRDSELGRQLEALGDPEHGPDYWRDVRLAVAEASAEVRRRGFGRRLRAALAPRWARLALAGAACAVATAAVLLVALPGTPSAAEVLDRALATYSSGRTWQADAQLRLFDAGMWKRYHAYVTRRIHTVRAADGSEHTTYSAVTVAGRSLVSAAIEIYDSTTGVGTGYDSSERVWMVGKNGPLGPPDAGTIPLVDFSATIQALASSKTLKLDETVFGGRPAWTVSCSKGELIGLPPSSGGWPVYTVTVDKKTWLPLRLQEMQRDRITFSICYRNVRMDEPPPKDAFTAQVPPGAEVTREDGGFRRLALDEAVATPGVMPLVPGFVPDGYELSQVAVAEHAALTLEVAEDVEKTFGAKHVFALAYRRGFDALTVTTRIVDGDYPVDVDPCEGDQVWSKRARSEVPITAGAFAGVTARVHVTSTSAAPHLWAVKDGVLLTIAGAASAEELLAVAESLQVYPGSSPAAE